MSTLTRWRPWRDMETLEQRMDDWFDRFGSRFFGPQEHARSVWGDGAWAPALESRIDNGNLIVKADLPGIDPKERKDPWLRKTILTTTIICKA